MGTPREPQGPITIDITYGQIMEAVYGGISMMDHVKSRDKLEFFAHGGNTDCLHQLAVEIARQVMAEIMRSVVAPDYFEGLEQMLVNEDRGGEGWWEGWETLKAAHAQAKGETTRSHHDG